MRRYIVALLAALVLVVGAFAMNKRRHRPPAAAATRHRRQFRMTSGCVDKPTQERVMQRRLFLAAAPALGLSIAANRGWAETTPKPMVVSSGGTTGTYYRLMKEFDEAAPGVIVNTESDGSLTNVDRVMDNQAELGITQLDALYIRAHEGDQPQGTHSRPGAAALRGNPLHRKVASAKRGRHPGYPFRLKARRPQFGRRPARSEDRLLGRRRHHRAGHRLADADRLGSDGVSGPAHGSRSAEEPTRSTPSWRSAASRSPG